MGFVDFEQLPTARVDKRCMIRRIGQPTHELTGGDSDYVPELMHSRLEVLAWHVTMRLRVDRVLAETPAHYRRASRILIAQGRGLLVDRGETIVTR